MLGCSTFSLNYLKTRMCLMVSSDNNYRWIFLPKLLL